MVYESIKQWIIMNLQLIIIIVVLIGFISYQWGKKHLAKMKAQEAKEEKSQQQQATKTNEIDLDSFALSNEFRDVHYMEESHIEKLKSQLSFARDEIAKKTTDYKKAKEHYKELLEIEKRLRFHIQNLRELEKTLVNQVQRLEGGPQQQPAYRGGQQ